MRKIFALLLTAFLLFSLTGCAAKKTIPKIGVSFGVGEATRWPSEAEYMKTRAKELGAEIEVRLNKDEVAKSQKDDCFELIDSGVDVLLITARDVYNMQEVLDYAQKKKVPVISYSRLIMNEPMELFVGYDSGRMGQRLGQALSETVISGDYILLRGDEKDYNAELFHDGAMQYIDKNKNNINIILDASVPGWSTEEAKKLVLEAVAKNGNKVDAILAPNDKIAGACAEALAELQVITSVAITGMDAELDAVKRIVAGTQSCTVYMDFSRLANTAIDEAYNLATGEKVNVNADFENGSGAPIPANLITGQLVTKDNVERILIESGYYTKEQIYGDATGK